ncbi:hypothetical protein MN205_12575 [Kineococcus sp. TRM81007]|uniref:hypothetical protein n=1 Tax=Kineococcus sp. TRM81007 TaxID=2925831 RepID=UPI001F5AE33E|nr:hypothetical protein [Kineococcus sp. TRM81007]MCI2239323.1 hypothetical protein [Kineococcus sp. TRM81007]
MRRAIARLLLLAGVGCAVAGALLLTVLAPPGTLTAGVRPAAGSVAVVTTPGLLELSGPAATVRASAEDGRDVFVGVTTARDARAWLGEAARTEVTGVAGDLDEPLARTGAQGSGAAADPRAADVWLASADGPGSAELTWDTTSDEALDAAGGAVAVVTTDGTAAAPQQVELTWRLTGDAARHPVAVPLAAGGAVLAVLGAVGLLLHRRRPARGSRPPARPARQETR